MSTILVHDLRLDGQTPTSLADRSIEVDATCSITGLMQTIVTSSNATISRLLIMCHGYESTDSGSACIPMTLGFGLCLCMEDLTLANAGVSQVLSGAVTDIILYACGPANVTAMTKGTSGDGVRFCMELAAFTNANVYASDTSQSYELAKYDPGKMVCESIPIDFGNWEGNVYRFMPDGTYTMVESNPAPAD